MGCVHSISKEHKEQAGKEPKQPVQQQAQDDNGVEDEQQKVKELKMKELGKCAFCKTNPIEVRLKPCMHGVACETCAQQIVNSASECPECKGIPVAYYQIDIFKQLSVEKAPQDLIKSYSDSQTPRRSSAGAYSLKRASQLGALKESQQEQIEIQDLDSEYDHKDSTDYSVQISQKFENADADQSGVSAETPMPVMVEQG